MAQRGILKALPVYSVGMDASAFDSLFKRGRQFFKALPLVLLALIIVSGLSVVAAYNCGTERGKTLVSPP